MTGGEPVPTFDDCFDALASVGYRVAYRLLGDRSDAEDTAQEAVARAFARWGRVADHAEPWVARTTANLALDQLRARGRRRRRELRDEPSAGTEAARLAIQRVELGRALRALPARQRQVVVLRYLADRPEAEVADALGLSLGTVKRHAHRGLAALRVALDPPVPDGSARGAAPAEPLLDPGGS